jgi:hypothetical protein
MNASVISIDQGKYYLKESGGAASQEGAGRVIGSMTITETNMNIGYNLSYLPYRIGHVFPIWQP